MNPDIQKAFHEAVSNNDIETARRMIAAGADVNAPYDEYENRSFLDACYRGNLDLVKMLLEAGSNPNISGGKLGSPLSIVMRDKEFWSAELLIKFGAKFSRSEDYYADEVLENINDHILFYNMKDNGIPFRTDDAAVVLYAKHACSYLLRKALEAGANPNAADSTGKSALAWALEHPRHSQGCAGRLIQHGATFNPDLILYAVRKGKRELFKALLKAGADVNVADEKGNTALHYATRTNREYFVRDLISAGANIEARNKADYTPLMLAVRYRCYSAAGCLLANGADEYAIGSKYRESSMAMCRRYHCQIKNNKLIKKEWNSESLKNLTPFRFCWAAQSGGIAKIQSLKEQRLDINTQDEEGYTALHLGSDQEEVIPLLIQSGADMYIETYPNEWERPHTPAMLAADGSELECLKKFLACGYDVNHKDSYGTTLLMFCACRFLPSLVEFLLENGANPSLKDNKGQTALFYATYHNLVCYDEIIDYLLEYGANINEVDNEGNSALLQIADEEIEGDATHRDLIDRGIDVNIRNNAGQTALSIAKLHGHKRLIAELLEAGAIDS